MRYRAAARFAPLFAILTLSACQTNRPQAEVVGEPDVSVSIAPSETAIALAPVADMEDAATDSTPTATHIPVTDAAAAPTGSGGKPGRSIEPVSLPTIIQIEVPDLPERPEPEGMPTTPPLMSSKAIFPKPAAEIGDIGKPGAQGDETTIKLPFDMPPHRPKSPTIAGMNPEPPAKPAPDPKATPTPNAPARTPAVEPAESATPPGPSADSPKSPRMPAEMKPAVEPKPEATPTPEPKPANVPDAQPRLVLPAKPPAAPPVHPTALAEWRPPMPPLRERQAPNQTVVLEVGDRLQVIYTRAPQSGPYQVRPGDRLRIEYLHLAKPDANSHLDRELLVQPDGQIALPYIGAVPVAGKTLEAIKKDLDQRYLAIDNKPDLLVTLTATGSAVLDLRAAERSAGGLPATVAPGGKVNLPVIGFVQAAGRPLDQVETEVQSRLAALLPDVRVTVRLYESMY